MMRFIFWIIILFIGANILGQVIRSVRLLLTPNMDGMNKNVRAARSEKKPIEYTPYEEIKEKDDQR